MLKLALLAYSTVARNESRLAKMDTAKSASNNMSE